MKNVPDEIWMRPVDMQDDWPYLSVAATWHRKSRILYLRYDVRSREIARLIAARLSPETTRKLEAFEAIREIISPSNTLTPDGAQNAIRDVYDIVEQITERSE